jgi:hypothetical protein
MNTAEHREKLFRDELKQLLDKHGAVMVITDDGKPYGMHSSICRIEMEEIYDDADTGEVLAEFCEFEI